MVDKITLRGRNTAQVLAIALAVKIRKAAIIQILFMRVWPDRELCIVYVEQRRRMMKNEVKALKYCIFVLTVTLGCF